MNESRGRGVFNVQALRAAKAVILCEAIIDALTFWCAGYRNVTTAYGVEGFTPELLAAFKQNGTQRVLIATLFLIRKCHRSPCRPLQAGGFAVALSLWVERP